VAFLEERIPDMSRHPTRRANRRLAATVVGAAIAGTAALAYAHNGEHPVIHGPKGSLGVVVPAGGAFQVPKVLLDCPPPENADPCVVTVAVRTRSAIKLAPSKQYKVVKLGRVKYSIPSNREQAPLNPVPLTAKGTKALQQKGTVKALVNVNINQHEPIIREFKMILKQS
jgi:hypothetical protein